MLYPVNHTVSLYGGGQAAGQSVGMAPVGEAHGDFLVVHPFVHPNNDLSQAQQNKTSAAHARAIYNY